MNPLRKLFSGAVFRLALLYTLGVVACVAGIGWMTRAAVNEALEAQARQRIETEASALVDEFNHGGRPDLDAALVGRFANGQVIHRYAVIEPDGRVSLGDRTLALAAPSDVQELRSVRKLADGSHIIIVDDLAAMRAVEAIVTRAFLYALAVAAILGLGTGLLLSGAILARIDRITRIANSVADGNLGQRIPLTGSGDEFDRLAGTLNRMLDRIGALLDGLRQVSSDVAHDLRTPLSRLRQRLEKAQLQATTAETYREAVGRALSEVDSILDIFSALLRITQIESGARRSSFTRVDLTEVMRHVGEAYGASIEEQGRTLSTRLAGDVAIHGDRQLLIQLFANLIENALQHTPEGSHIVLTLETDAGSALAQVADDGPGIPQTEQAKVFRRFYRIDKSRAGSGHGLGLSLVAAIADLHGAAIALHDNHPGLRVSLTFPAEVARGGPAA